MKNIIVFFALLFVFTLSVSERLMLHVILEGGWVAKVFYLIGRFAAGGAMGVVGAQWVRGLELKEQVFAILEDHRQRSNSL